MPGATSRLSGRPLEPAGGAAVLAALSSAPVSFWEATPSPASAPADAALDVFVACGSVADAPEASASPDGARGFSMISCLPMGRPRCGGELDRIAVTNWLAFGGLGAPHSAVTATVRARITASHAQVPVLHRRRGRKLAGTAAPYDFAALDQIITIGDADERRDVLVDHQDRLAGVLEPREALPDFGADERCEPLGRFVQDQEPRVGHQRATDRQHLLFAAGALVR